jgi:hypothetical protein
MNKILSEDILAKTRRAPIARSAKWNWKWLRLGGLLAVFVFGTGCSGIHASKSISPLDFFLPGIMKNDPAPSPESIPSSSAGELLAQRN